MLPSALLSGLPAQGLAPPRGVAPGLAMGTEGFVGPGSPLPEGAAVQVLSPVASAEPFLAATIRFVPLSGDPLIDGALFDGRAWSSILLTYAFPDSPYDYEYPYGNYLEPWQAGFGQVSARQMLAIRGILEGGSLAVGLSGYNAVESLTDLDFVWVGQDGGDLRFAETGVAVAPAWTYLPSDTPVGGDTWFIANYPEYDFGDPVLGDYFYLGHMHEILHGLGLKDGSFAHPAATGSPATPALPADRDSLEFSIGSYRSFVGAPLDGYRNETYGYPQSPMMIDIAALQYLYGADFSTNATDSTYRWNTATGEMTINGVGQGLPGTNRVFLTIWDGGGTDTYDLSNYATPLRIDLAPGGWSTLSALQLAVLNDYDGYAVARANVFNALQYQGDPRSLIENAIGGTGDDSLLGNAAANHLLGGAGADTLDGGVGADTIDGGTGIDRLVGGAGDDRYVVDIGQDLVIEQAGGGFDTVHALSSVNLWAEVEALQLGGTLGYSANGNALANAMSGNGAANRLAGGGGNDTLVGLDGDDTLDGGAGYDSMEGGAGNDTFHVNVGQDQVVELPGGGIDLVIASASVNLAAEVENLTLLTSLALNANGNALGNLINANPGANRIASGGGNDTLYGLAGDDTLDGDGGHDVLIGGTGADSMPGGTGNDRYVVDHAGDLVVEAAGGGLDQVLAYVDVTLAEQVESLALLGAAVAGTGNALGNTLAGNALANLLRGLGGNDTLAGGDGADTLEGGAGNDLLTGGTGGDRFRLGAPDGSFDRVQDFVPGSDLIEVRAADYGGLLSEGPLAPGQFAGAGIAVGAGAQFVYVPATGALRWDADGAGGAASVTVAMLTGAPLLAAADILVVA